jgi:GNAT superfamily N-acetyltransferase
MTIRPMTREDLLAVAALSDELGYPVGLPNAERRFDRLVSGGHGLFVADESDRVLGWIHISQGFTLTDEPLAVIDALIVDENARSRGIGRQLVTAAESWAAAHGHDKLRVRTRVIRDRAHSFYRKAGFVLNKTQHVFDKTLSQA